MAIARRFLGWSGLATTVAAEALRALAQETADASRAGLGACDLSNVLLVTPTNRAGRRVLAELARQLDGRAFAPPTVTTPGRLPESLGRTHAGRRVLPPAGALLAWANAVAELDAQAQDVLALSPSAGLGERLALAQRLIELADELAGQGLSIHDLARQRDRATFDAAAAVERTLRNRLADAEWIDPAEARLVNTGQLNPPANFDRVIGLGVTDWPSFAKSALEQAAPHAVVECWVWAPESLGEHFDPWGVPEPQAWAQRHIEVDPAQLDWADGPDDTAGRALHALAETSLDTLNPSDVSIVLADPSISPAVQRRLSAQGVQSHRASGTPAGQTRPGLLLRLAGRYLEQQGFAELADLVRHPDLDLAEHDAESSSAWAGLIDRYLTDHVQHRVTSDWLDGPLRERLARAHRATHALLPDAPDARRPATERLDQVGALLEQVYGQAKLDPATAEGLDAIAGVLTDAAASSQAGANAQANMTAAEALAWVSAALDARAVAADPYDPAVELIGPVDALWDDASAMAVVGVHEGALPSASYGSPWLSEADRESLGLPTARERYAAEAYRFEALLRGRPGVPIVAGRVDDEGSPLRPSRLLLSTAPQVVAQRVLAYYDETPLRPVASGFAPVNPSESPSPGAEAGFGPPEPRPAEEAPHARSIVAVEPQGRNTLALSSDSEAPRDPLDPLSVTAFRVYLACPYRFYLKHVLRLRAVEDAPPEMGAALFGSVAHAVLQRFALEPEAASQDTERVARCFGRLVDDEAAQRFGQAGAAPAVRFQIDRLHERLAALAPHQAEAARAGWRIDSSRVEQSYEAALGLGEGFAPLRLLGRIDRVDLRDDGGVRVIDYKTSSSGHDPRATHRKAGRWIDLQLPLYQHIAETLGWGQPVEVGYLRLPSDPANAGWAAAQWDGKKSDPPHEDLHQQALEKAREVGRDIRRGTFWPPGEVPQYPDGLEHLCCDGSRSRPQAEAGASS
ncbi:MAG: PD-(D/E)XK nuclease family protein [Planctomycetota bacterium]